MANINLTFQPDFENIRYYINNVLDGTVDVSLNPTNNPIVWKFESDTTNPPYNSTPSRFELYLTLSDIIANTITTNFNILEDDTVTILGEIFTAKDSNPGLNEFFSCPLGTAQQRLLTVQSLSDAINSNLNISSKYNCTSDFATVPGVIGGPTYYIVLTAKEVGTNFNLSVNNFFDFVYSFVNANPLAIPYYLIEGSDSSRGMQLQNFNYGCFVEIWRYIDGVDLGRRNTNNKSQKIATLSQKWNKSNKFEFNLSGFLSNLVPKINIPDFNTPLTVFTYFEGLNHYYLKYGEQFNGGYYFDSTSSPSSGFLNNYYPENDKNNITDTYTRKYYIDETPINWIAKAVLPLGIQNPNFQDKWNQLETIGTTNSIKPINILSNLTELKNRKRFENPEYIFLVVQNDQENNDLRSLRLKTYYRFIDGTLSAPVNYTHVINNVNLKPGIYGIDVSLGIINFNQTELLNNTRILEIYHQIQISKDGGAIWEDLTPEFSYEMDLNNDPEQYKTLYWRNPYGVIEQFTFEGFKQETVSIDRTTYNQNYKYDSYSRDKKVKSIFKNDIVIEKTMNSGWINKENYKWLKELLTSTEWWTIEETTKEVNGFYNHECNFESQTILKYDWNIDEFNDLYNLTITYTTSIPENSIIE